MATKGSYRKLKDNSIAAISAAIEIYNKPRISYREQVVVILVINSWELILKSLILKSNGKIFHRKKRNGPTQSLTFWESYSQAGKSRFWPKSLDRNLVRENLELLNDFRNNVVHFYSDLNSGTIMYLAISAAVRNLNLLLEEAFEQNLSDEMNLTILPIGNLNPAELVENLLQKPQILKSSSAGSILGLLVEKMNRLDANSVDINQLLLGVNVELRSIKTNSTKSKVQVSVVGSEGFDEGKVLIRDRDPNLTHPLTFTDLAKTLKDKHNLGRNHLSNFLKRTGYQTEPNLCWTDERTKLKRYSHQLRSIIEASALSEFYLPQKESKHHKI